MEPPEQSVGITRAEQFFNLAYSNPYLHFTASEIQGAFASASVYAVFHLASFFIEKLVEFAPLSHPEPAEVLSEIFAWLAVAGATISFAAVTIFGLITLISALWPRKK